MFRPAFNKVFSSVFASVFSNDSSPVWFYGEIVEPLAFDALTYDPSTYEMLGVKTGTGDLSAVSSSTHYPPEHEGIYREYAANSLVWCKGRTISVYTPSSTDLVPSATSGWADPFSRLNIVSGITDPEGGSTAVSLEVHTTATAVLQGNGNNYKVPAGPVIRSSWWIRAVTVTGVVRIYPGVGSAAIGIEHLLTSSWQRITLSSRSGSTGTMGIVIVNIGDKIEVWHPQYEDVTGKTDDSPSEFVATPYATSYAPILDGAITATYANLNGNTVTDNVVTEAVGAALPEVPYLQYYPAATNSVPNSTDFTQSNWAKSLNIIVAYDQIGLTGAANSASLLTDNHATEIALVLDKIGITSGNTVYTWKSWIVKDNDETRFPRYRFQVGGGTQQYGIVHVNTKTGAIIEVNSLGTISFEVVDAGNEWMVVMSVTDNSSGNYTTELQVSPAGGTVFGIDNIAATGSAIYRQNELHPDKTIAEVRGLDPIFTTTAAVATTAIDPISADAANHSDTSGLYYLEWTPSYATSEATGDQIILTLNGAAGLLYYDATAGAFKSTDGTNTVSCSKVIVAGTTYKLALTYHASDGKMQLSCDDTDGTEGTYDGVFTTTGDLEYSGGGDYSTMSRGWQRYNIASQSDGYTLRDTLL